MITPCLSPAQCLRDLLGLRDVAFLSRKEGRERLSSGPDGGPRNGEWDDRAGRWKVPALKITLVAHFLPADLTRIFGNAFLLDLLETGGVRFSAREPLRIVEPRDKFHTSPIVEYIETCDGDLFAVMVETRDTMLPFGPASLEQHSQTFLGLGKLEGLSDADKADMSRTFQKKPRRAYAYAIRDAVNTLLVFEEMQKQDRDLYHHFGIRDEDIPPMRSTVGGRVADFLCRTTENVIGNRSNHLRSSRDIRFLMKQGSSVLFQHGQLPSVFGVETALVHGGLNFSRSPTMFFHQAPGMLRDVDMASCYSSVIARMNVYWGRPVIFEPGRRSLTAREAVESVQRHAEPDAWMIRVTGDIRSIANVLIPSTDEATTSENFRQKMRERLLADAFDEAERLPELGGGRLYSQRIESGVVTHDTWLMIQAMPEQARREYESLTADSIIFYPRSMAASNATEYDELFDRYNTDQLPWDTILDMEKLEATRKVYFDAEYVTLRFPIGHLAAQIGCLREKAKKDFGRKSGQDTALKLLANNIYGVLGSRYYATQNIVAANIITARARAEACAMMLALNGIQLITDGCTYRADQVPACTFEECLRRQPDNPLRRAEADSGIPFLDPESIPTAPAAFTDWYRQHVKRFFGVSGQQYDELFGTHQLEHRPTAETNRIAFDGLACDGTANYVKCTRLPHGEWLPEDFRARSYGKESKAAILPWLISTYSNDQLRELAPLVEEDALLKFDEAVQKVRAAVNDGVETAFFPLGLPETIVCNYRAIKVSAEIFKTPKQRKTILRQIEKFEQRYECGVEGLALRRPYRGRKAGSLTGIAEELYAAIQEDTRNLTKRLNLNRPFDALTKVAVPRRDELRERRACAKERLRKLVDMRFADLTRFPVGLVVGKSDLHLLDVV